MPERRPIPPSHLSKEAKAIWRDLLRRFDFESHHLQILQAAMEAEDRGEQARLAIAVDGPYVAGRFGPRPHPALAVERDSRLAMVRCLRELGLDFEIARYVATTHEVPLMPRVRSRSSKGLRGAEWPPIADELVQIRWDLYVWPFSWLTLRAAERHAAIGWTARASDEIERARRGETHMNRRHPEGPAALLGDVEYARKRAALFGTPERTDFDG